MDDWSYSHSIASVRELRRMKVNFCWNDTTRSLGARYRVKDLCQPRTCCLHNARLGQHIHTHSVSSWIIDLCLQQHSANIIPFRGVTELQVGSENRSTPTVQNSRGFSSFLASFLSSIWLPAAWAGRHLPLSIAAACRSEGDYLRKMRLDRFIHQIPE